MAQPVFRSIPSPLIADPVPGRSVPFEAVRRRTSPLDLRVTGGWEEVMTAAIRRLGEGDAPAYRRLRLEALLRHPCEFKAAFEEEVELPMSAFAERLENSTVLGAFLAGDLVGIAGFKRPLEAKKRHKGELWGVYVSLQARRTGLGEALVRAVIRHARLEVEQLHATVASLNHPARALYEKLGFRCYGTEPRAHKVKERYFDQDLLVLPLDH